MIGPNFEAAGDANRGSAALGASVLDENKSFDAAESLSFVDSAREKDGTAGFEPAKLKPFEGAFGFTADGGAPKSGLDGVGAVAAGAAAPKEKEAFEGVGAVAAGAVARKEKEALAGVGAVGANEIFANGLDLGGVPS